MNKKEKDLIKKVSDIITDFENIDTAEILKADNTIAGYDTIIKNVALWTDDYSNLFSVLK